MHGAGEAIRGNINDFLDQGGDAVRRRVNCSSAVQAADLSLSAGCWPGARLRFVSRGRRGAPRRDRGQGSRRVQQGRGRDEGEVTLGAIRPGFSSCFSVLLYSCPYTALQLVFSHNIGVVAPGF